MDRTIYLTVFLLFLISEMVILSVNTVANFWDSLLNLGIYKKSILQALGFFSGLIVALYVIPHIKYERLKTRGFSYGVITISILLLIAVIVKKYATGKPVDRWLIGSSIQPMEFTKIAVIMFLSYYVAYKGSLKEYKYIFWSFSIVISNVLLILFQPDRGAAIFILAISGAILFVGGLPIRIFAPILGILVVSIAYILFGQKSYVQSRFSAWSDPFKDAEDTGYQIIQSLYALADGGLLGKGIGKGIQKMGYLPQADTDFVISTIGEELGFIGLMVLFLLYLILISRIFYWSLELKDLFSKLVLFGIGTNFALAFLWNVAVATNLSPPKGIALPFVSYGFSNMFMSLIMVGIAQEVIKHGKNSILGGGWDSKIVGRKKF